MNPPRLNASRLNSFGAILAAGCLALTVAACNHQQSVAASPAQAETYDIVILDGRVIDPETGLDATMNVGVRGDTIVAVTADEISGEREIDASGKIVAPGFIDYHAHGQRILSGRVQAFDGVTTALELEAGMLPLAEYYENAQAEGRPIHYGASVNWAHARMAVKIGEEPTSDLEYAFRHLSDPRWSDTIAEDPELAEILARVQQGLDEGGLGVGVLLGYAPGSGRKEYFALNQLAADNGVSTFTHARFLSAIEPRSSFEGYLEMVGVSAATGAHMHICHLNSISLRDVYEIAELISDAQSRGINITVEAYPYGAGATGIGAAMFTADRWQERMGGVAKSDFTLNGQPLTDAEFDRLQAEAPGTGIVVHFLDPEKRASDQRILDQSMLFPGGLIASDGGIWTGPTGQILDQRTWPLPPDSQSHPRSAGTYSRFLRMYVREREAISLIDAIAKTSYLPAATLESSVPQLAKKGRLQVGADADIVIFDLETVSDRATFEQPAQTSVGFEYVIVAGTPLITKSKLDTTVFPGRAIRRSIAN